MRKLAGDATPVRRPVMAAVLPMGGTLTVSSGAPGVTPAGLCVGVGVDVVTAVEPGDGAAVRSTTTIATRAASSAQGMVVMQPPGGLASGGVSSVRTMKMPTVGTVKSVGADVHPLMEKEAVPGPVDVSGNDEPDTGLGPYQHDPDSGPVRT
jgi:hypothetical protein